ncbi:tetraspanin-9-like [Corticium candelabrum]|uniref:tetraspanin-9-like n=1 Tax=Corticium candelabrum TaxID=121492 RepID=UPI002E2665CA|nr:tetraspanin-9-like [Corticium candelabrum]
MAVEGCSKCLKWLLFVFNIIFFAIGVIVLGLGAWLYVEFDSFLDDLAGVKYLNGPILLMVVGSIITLIAFLGCCGACMENKIMLYLFGILMIVTFALELVGGILAYVNDYDEELKATLYTTLPTYSNNSVIKDAWNTAQKNLDCCGVENYTDWQAYLGPQRVPSSCCKTDPCTIAGGPDGIVNLQLLADLPINTIGCYEEVKSKFEGNTVAVAAVGISFAVVQLLGIIFAFVVGCNIESSPEVV